LSSDNNFLRLGGQALPEGILIKGPIYTVIAYRSDNNEIKTASIKWGFRITNYLRRVPFIRGLVTIVETLGLSLKSIFVMAELTDEEINTDSIFFKFFISFMFVLVAIFTVSLIIYLPKFSSSGIVNIFDINSDFIEIGLELLIRFSIFFVYIYFYRFFDIGKTMQTRFISR